MKLKKSVTLQPRTEHILWVKLPMLSDLSIGSAVIVEPPTSRTLNQNVIVDRVVAPLWGDGWVPVKVLNPLDEPLTLRCNSKLADVSPGIALEDFDLSTCTGSIPQETQQKVYGDIRVNHQSVEDIGPMLQELEQAGLDLNSCEVSEPWKAKVRAPVAKYNGLFSRNKLDCGEAKDFVHCIHLKDEWPFRLPYRRVSPADYHKLKVVLDEMEEKGIIRKSCSEWASPLVLVWKKNGDLRVCTDFRELKRCTFKDAFPLPHRSDALAALGGNVFFSSMDLTSGFNNVLLHEDDKRFTACTTPVGLYEYNRLPQHLCNSPGSFMRLMTSIFSDQNYTSLLCYLDDLLIFAPSEELALERPEMVFSRLQNHGLKLAPKKCHLLRWKLKLLGHIITENSVSTDPEKVEVITNLTGKGLMMEDECTPSPRKLRSVLGMFNYCNHFIQGFSTLARPLYKLTSEPKSKPRSQHPK